MTPLMLHYDTSKVKRERRNISHLIYHISTTPPIKDGDRICQATASAGAWPAVLLNSHMVFYCFCFVYKKRETKKDTEERKGKRGIEKEYNYDLGNRNHSLYPSLVLCD